MVVVQVFEPKSQPFRRFNKWASKLMLAAFVVPLNDGSGWQNLVFSKISANQVSFSKQGLKVEVKKSASPLIFPLKQQKEIYSVSVKGAVNRLISFKDKKQGEKGADDYVLRLGFVVPGEKTLNWAQRQIAADWVLKLFSLAPKGAGVDHIYFLNLGQVAEDRGREREHPLSDLIKERNEWVITEAGNFELSANFKKPKSAAALWISIDGDDTGAKYTTTLQSIKLNDSLEEPTSTPETQSSQSDPQTESQD